MNALFRKKAVESHDSDKGLKRTLSALDLTLLGIGAIIGTGVAAATQAGSAVGLVIYFAYGIRHSKLAKAGT